MVLVRQILAQQTEEDENKALLVAASLHAQSRSQAPTQARDVELQRAADARDAVLNHDHDGIRRARLQRTHNFTLYNFLKLTDTKQSGERLRRRRQRQRREFDFDATHSNPANDTDSMPCSYGISLVFSIRRYWRREHHPNRRS